MPDSPATWPVPLPRGVYQRYQRYPMNSSIWAETVLRETLPGQLMLPVYCGQRNNKSLTVLQVYDMHLYTIANRLCKVAADDKVRWSSMSVISYRILGARWQQQTMEPTVWGMIIMEVGGCGERWFCWSKVQRRSYIWSATNLARNQLSKGMALNEL